MIHSPFITIKTSTEIIFFSSFILFRNNLHHQLCFDIKKFKKKFVFYHSNHLDRSDIYWKKWPWLCDYMWCKISTESRCVLTRQQHHSQQSGDDHTRETGSPSSSHDFASSSPANTKDWCQNYDTKEFKIFCLLYVDTVFDYCCKNIKPPRVRNWHFYPLLCLNHHLFSNLPYSCILELDAPIRGAPKLPARVVSCPEKKQLESAQFPIWTKPETPDLCQFSPGELEVTLAAWKWTLIQRL